MTWIKLSNIFSIKMLFNLIHLTTVYTISLSVRVVFFPFIIDYVHRTLMTSLKQGGYVRKDCGYQTFPIVHRLLTTSCAMSLRRWWLAAVGCLIYIFFHDSCCWTSILLFLQPYCILRTLFHRQLADENGDGFVIVWILLSQTFTKVLCDLDLDSDLNFRLIY